jgi:hypothetical protein
MAWPQIAVALILVIKGTATVLRHGPERPAECAGRLLALATFTLLLGAGGFFRI